MDLKTQCILDRHQVQNTKVAQVSPKLAPDHPTFDDSGPKEMTMEMPMQKSIINMSRLEGADKTPARPFVQVSKDPRKQTQFHESICSRPKDVINDAQLKSCRDSKPMGLLRVTVKDMESLWSKRGLHNKEKFNSGIDHLSTIPWSEVTCQTPNGTPGTDLEP
ncbi:hypothetical protein JTE90_020528 [Oedothorax gibbosus]|uniref:Uncharacterized protein n=1 Tax=Oedothorax gibbosus TaxID=931172 RepID=A0AAV6VXU9_9ARAC|nr:hypothetical protein JTE90_020528 [Oedothorax gibbosus]